MKVLVFSTDDFLPPAGGAEIAFREIARRCPEVSFDLVCARLRPGTARTQTVENITIRRIGFGIPWLDRLLLGAFGCSRGLALHRRGHYDLVWAILASYGGFAAACFKRAAGVPFLLTLQEGTDTGLIERRTAWFRPLFRTIFSSADAMTAISSYLLAWGTRMGFSGVSAQVVPNGVGYESFHNAVGGSSGGVTLISVSRFVKKNGLEDLIDALALLPSHIRLVLAGDGPLRARLQAQIRRLGLGDRVRLTGFVPHQDTPALLKSADIFVRPSISEGLGNAFLEAMAAGIPVIGTAVGGIPDFLTDGETGFVCALHDPASIAHVVQRILDLSPDERARILGNADRVVRERFTWDRIAGTMRSIFTRLCPTP